MAIREMMRSVILKALPQTYIWKHNTNQYRSSVITPDVAHTHTTVKRIEHAHHIVNRHLDDKQGFEGPTQMAEGARTMERGKSTAPTSWELWKIFSWRLVESPICYWTKEGRTVPETSPEACRLSGGSIVVGGVMSGKNRKLRDSIATSTLDGHLSNTQSSHSHRHGFYRVFAINVRFGFEAGSTGIESISRIYFFLSQNTFWYYHMKIVLYTIYRVKINTKMNFW